MNCAVHICLLAGVMTWGCHVMLATLGDAMLLWAVVGGGGGQEMVKNDGGCC